MTNMTKESKSKSTGKADPQVATETPVPPGMQIHAGNVPVVTARLLDCIAQTLDRIADALEKQNG
jgi:hypothetical protein